MILSDLIGLMQKMGFTVLVSNDSIYLSNTTEISEYKAVFYTDHDFLSAVIESLKVILKPFETEWDAMQYLECDNLTLNLVQVLNTCGYKSTPSDNSLIVSTYDDTYEQQLNNFGELVEFTINVLTKIKDAQRL